MLDDWDERNQRRRSICPGSRLPRIGGFLEPARGTGRDNVKSWRDFACTRCGTDFTIPEDELIFQPVPKQWLLASVQAA